MSGNSLIVDTNIIIYVLANDSKAIELANGKQIHVSFITELELLKYKSFNVSEKNILEKLLKSCIIIDINTEIKKFAVEYSLKYGLKLPDAIIAGTASYLNMPLATADKNFKNIKEIDLFFYEH